MGMNDLVKRLRKMDSDLLKDMKRKDLRTQDILLLSDLAEMVRECADEIEMLEKANAQLRHIVETEQDITEEEALLREIDRELDAVEYLGSYAEGIKALKAQLAAMTKERDDLIGRPIPKTEWQQMEEQLAACQKEQDKSLRHYVAKELREMAGDEFQGVNIGWRYKLRRRADELENGK